MNLLFYLGHPAHYHNLKYVTRNLAEMGHNIIIVAREKDVLLDLVKNEPHTVLIMPVTSSQTQQKKLSAVIKREFFMLRAALKYKIDLFIGTDFVMTHIAKLLRKKSILLMEDDTPAVPLFAKYGMKYATVNVVPEGVNVSPFESTTIRYKGYQELAYLRPEQFKPDKSKLPWTDYDKKHYIMRFAKLSAHHDDGIRGISTNLAGRIIEILSELGSVYITSERPLEPEFEKYRIALPPMDIHHVLYYADLYIGDSQTMATESGLLGTPSIRISDFVGRLSVIEELQHTYNLTVGFTPDNEEAILAKISELAKNPESKKKWIDKKDRLFDEKIDVAKFLTWFIDAYPESEEIMRKNPDYQLRFLSQRGL